ncbi:hypothetical protein V6N12_025393 [Hibiscus sabdariffa]|uniref:Uncharacterized protein n=1 Tax=Hibiscus sabdariffa TaxID=183260 RepID=A0ABR2CID1_9ROSI
MASPSGCPDQPQPDPNQNPNPNPNQPPDSSGALGTQALQPRGKPDDHEGLIEEEANVDDPDLSVPSSPPNSDLLVTTPTGFRRGGGPKGKKNTTRRRFQGKKAQKKLEILSEVLNPIPFVPNKTLDFLSHENLLKRLGLWDFVHLEFDRDLRLDLIAQLIATYNSQNRCSYVSGYRIGVNRADLSRALNLYKKKDKDIIVDIEESKESVGFLEELVSYWVLLHEDTWMMPADVFNWTKMIKEGHFEKVDWAGLIWFMMEKELTAAPNLKNCYYASHMQRLIKYQKEDLLLEKPEKGGYDAKEEEEEHNVPGDFKMSAGSVNESQEGSQLEEKNIELSLGGQDNLMNKDVIKEAVVGDEDVMDCEGSKKDEPQLVQWHLDGDSHMDVGGENFLRRCDLGDVDMVEEKKQEKGEEVDMGKEEEIGEGEEEQEEYDEQEEQLGEGFPISPKGDNLEGVHSTNLLEGMETVDLPITTGLHIRDNSPGEFLVSRVDAQKVPAVSSFPGNGNKREIDHENDLNLSSKRLSTDRQWDKSSEFDMCMGQMQHLMEKARMLYVAKEQACGDSSMHQQVLLHELQQRDSVIEHLQKAKFEEQQKRQMEVYRLERELYSMENLLNGYRKALKETNRAFSI